MVFRLADGQTKRMLSSKVDATLIQKLFTNAHQKKREKKIMEIIMTNWMMQMKMENNSKTLNTPKYEHKVH